MDTYKKLFSYAKNVEPPHGLTHAVLARISFERERTARRRRLAFGVVSFASLAGILPALGLLISDATSSGIFQYITLLFSDKTILLQYGNEFAFSLVEAVPTASIALFLTLCALFIWSLAQAMRYSSHEKTIWI